MENYDFFTPSLPHGKYWEFSRPFPPPSITPSISREICKTILIFSVNAMDLFEKKTIRFVIFVY